MRVTSMGQTDVGRTREINQDSFLVSEDLGLFMVADGMGGHAGGEIASRLAVETIREHVSELRSEGALHGGVELEDSVRVEGLRDAVEAACYAVFHAAVEQPDLEGMGTTVSALLLQESAREGAVDAYVAHVGDSRVYLVRGSMIHQLSEDHTLVNEQLKAGYITSDQARGSRLRNIITRSVGFEEDVLVDMVGLWAEPGDTFLLCSDGLHGEVTEAEILEHVLRLGPASLTEVPSALVDLANERGGEDNITVVVVRVDEA